MHNLVLNPLFFSSKSTDKSSAIRSSNLLSSSCWYAEKNMLIASLFSAIFWLCHVSWALMKFKNTSAWKVKKVWTASIHHFVAQTYFRALRYFIPIKTWGRFQFHTPIFEQQNTFCDSLSFNFWTEHSQKPPIYAEKSMVTRNLSTIINYFSHNLYLSYAVPSKRSVDFLILKTFRIKYWIIHCYIITLQKQIK